MATNEGAAFMTNRCLHLSSRATPLASCIAALLGLTAGHEALAATTHFVSSCDDAGAGTLRAIVGDTVGTLSGDTIDFANVAPCTVTLKTGAIDITQNALTIQAPAGSRVSINGKYSGSTENDRLIHHTGTGVLGFSYVNFYNGSLTSASAVSGGCIYSAGSVQVISGNFVFCNAHSTANDARGGAVYAAKQLTMKYSSVLGAQATSDAGHALGGGLYGKTGVGMKYSSVSFNQVSGLVADRGGGVYTGGALEIKNSTISGNSASFSGGGVFQRVTNSYAHIYSSTISGNTSAEYIGGLALSAPDLIITNSTIAFNQSPTYNGLFGTYAAGLSIYAAANPTTLKLQSTIISNNSITTTSDLDMTYATGFGGGTFAFDAASSNNLIHIPGSFTLPPGTKTTCPHLVSLRDNGGFTMTHALASQSIAIDNGSNPKGFASDQRGNSTLYPRLSGPAPDIGAYEVNKDDIVFVDVFETCNEVL